MKRGLVLLHGLPGVGKSTLAQGFAARRPDFFYADIASHPSFRMKSMFALCADLYDSEGQGRSLITEGVMSRVRHRDTLAMRLMDHASKRQYPFEFAIIINLVAQTSLLASRRNRTAREYEKLAAAVEVGSTRFAYRTLKVAESRTNSLDEDIGRLMALVQESEMPGAPATRGSDESFRAIDG